MSPNTRTNLYDHNCEHSTPVVLDVISTHTTYRDTNCRDYVFILREITRLLFSIKIAQEYIRRTIMTSFKYGIETIAVMGTVLDRISKVQR